MSFQRYLHRPLKDELRKSIEDDSLKVVYEVDKPDSYFYGARAGNELLLI